MTVIQADLYFRYAIVILAIILWLLQILFPQNQWVDAFFVVIMAGNVGYFTNHLAIRMLFQPKHGKVLGWQGLVPRNKAKIARSLANSIQNQLLSPDIILAYIEEKNLIDKGINQLNQWIDGYLEDVEKRQELTASLVKYLRENGEELLTKLFEILEESLQEWAKSPEKVEKSWDFLRYRLKLFLANKKNRKEIARFIRNLFSQEIPYMARALNEALEEFLRRRKTLGKIGLSLKNLFSFNEENMEVVLEKFINDPDTTEQILGSLDILVEEFEKSMKDKKKRKIIMRKIRSYVNTISQFSRVSLFGGMVKWLQDYLQNENNWEKIEKMIGTFLISLKQKLQEFILTEKGKNFLRGKINKIVSQIRVKELLESQILKLDTDELEQMILSNTAGNLVMIQLIGGILGMVAGLIQVHYYFAFPILLFTAVVLIGAWQNRRKAYTEK